MVHLVDYGWEWREPEPEIPTPTPPHYDDEPDFLLLYLITFLICSLAIGLPLIFINYRNRKDGQKQQKPPEFDEYTEKIEKYHAKMEEWEKEGYDVSELKEVLEEGKNERK